MNILLQWGSERTGVGSKVNPIKGYFNIFFLTRDFRYIISIYGFLKVFISSSLAWGEIEDEEGGFGDSCFTFIDSHLL